MSIRRFFVVWKIAVFSWLLITAPAAGQDANGWKVGTAKVNITPKHDMWLAGYAARTEPSSGKLHDIWAKALALEDAAGNKALLITTDLLGFTKAISDRVRSGIEKRYGLTKAQIILSASHTHSAPVLDGALPDIYPPFDENQKKLIRDYTSWLEDALVSLAGNALKSMENVHIFAGNGVVRFEVNRRNNPSGEALRALTELKGPSDHAVPVLKITDDDGAIRAVVFGYACHPTTLDIAKISGDYPGYAQLELEREFPGMMAMFFQGAGADQNPLPRRTVPLAEQYGKELAAAVSRMMKESMKELAPELKTAYSEIDLTMEVPTPGELQQWVQELKSYQQQWAKSTIRQYEERGSLPSSYPFPLQIWKMGDQLLFALGGEVLVPYAQGIKRIFGQDAFVMGYANDVMSYIPPAYVLDEGGYEGTIAHRVYGLPGKWTPDIEPKIYSGFLQLAQDMGIEVPDRYRVEMMIKNNLLSMQNPRKKQLIARHIYSGFENAHDTYNAISTASDGKIYYVLSSAEYDKGGQMYVYDPKTDKTKFIADLTEACGEKDLKAISQGKSHVRFYEHDGKLYFSTHVGFYEMIDGMERLPVNPPEGYKLYPGGHFLSYDMEKGTFSDLAIAPDGEGIITMTMDKDRGQLYGITWPKGYFLHYDLKKGRLMNLGQISANGEAGMPGRDYRVLCRAMFVDDRDGKVYYSTSEGDIFFYDPEIKKISKLDDVNLRLDYFGKYDPADPGSMGYNWRQIVWKADEGVAYGVHGNSGYLFRFDPREPSVEIVERITSEPSKRSGMFDYFSYGYLGFDFGPDGQTIYYLTGGPLFVNGKRVKGKDKIAMGAARGLENLHLVTYNVPLKKYTDHGKILYPDGAIPTYVNSIAIGKDGKVYTLARFDHEGKVIEDLVIIPDPFR